MMKRLRAPSCPPDYNSFRDNLESLLLRMGITAQSSPDDGDETASDAPVQLKVGRVIVYIEEHLTEQLSLERLAEEAQLSKYQLIRLFRKEQDTTPWKFLVGKRLDKAKELLEAGWSPGQVAVGFYDQSHLSKVFREATGQTPKEYQEEHFKHRN